MPLPPLTSVVAVGVVVKFCADLVPLHGRGVVDHRAAGRGDDAANRDDPGADALDRPAVAVDEVPALVQLPRVLVIWSCGGTPMPPTPFT